MSLTRGTVYSEYGDSWDFKAEKALELMDENDVEKAVLMHGSMYGFQNQYHAKLLKEYPNRFCPSCTVDPFMTNHYDTLKYYLEELGFRLVKFEISSGGGLMGCHSAFLLDNDMMMRIYELIDKNGATLALDVGDILMPSHQPLSIARIADRFPKLKIVICHLLAPIKKYRHEWVASLHILKKSNIWFDLAALPKIINDGAYPYPSVCDIIQEAKDIVGVDRLIWGTDAPYACTHDKESTYEHLTDYIERNNCFTSEELKALYYDNAHTVYFS